MIQQRRYHIIEDAFLHPIPNKLPKPSLYAILRISAITAELFPYVKSDPSVSLFVKMLFLKHSKAHDTATATSSLSKPYRLIVSKAFNIYDGLDISSLLVKAQNVLFSGIGTLSPL